MLSLQNQTGMALPNNLSPTALDVQIPHAKSIFETETVKVPSSVKLVIIMITDEAHESPQEIYKHVSDHNSYLLPTNVILPQGVGISFLDADAPWDSPHPHNLKIVDEFSKKTVFETGRLDYTNSSKQSILNAGNYTVTDTKYPWIKGKIIVSSTQKIAPGADLIIGAFYTTTNKVLNNKDNDGATHPGWLDYYRAQFPINGFQILSEYNFHYAQCKYCPQGFWPDIKSADHTLMVYGTTQNFSQAFSKLAKMIWDNIYI